MQEQQQVSKFTLLGRRQDLVFGVGSPLTPRAPWPFYDVKGSPIIIGDYVSVCSGVYIHTHSHEFNKPNWQELPEVHNPEPTVIGHYVFLGVNVQVMPSCKKIGKHSVVGSGSIVTRDIPAYEIWAGNPAKKIGDVEKGGT